MARKVFKLYTFDKIKYKAIIINGIYGIRNKITGRIYFGSSQNCFERWNIHRSALRSNKHPNRHLQNSWNKWGEVNFIFYCSEFITVNRYELLKIETSYITKYPKHYNIEKRPHLFGVGKSPSEETRRKLSLANKGRKMKPEFIEQNRLSHLGQKHTKEQIIKSRSTKNGKVIGMEIYQYDKNKNLIKVWETTITEIATLINTTRVNISQCLIGKQKSAHGFIWSYSKLENLI